jgi:pimeloyl-ACP methyl ester carboxylesterase
MTPEEQQAWAQVAEFQTAGNGYWREQATRPQTLGYALADSPVGLAAWIYEKFQAWTDNHGRPHDAVSNDRMLDNISVYWFTGTIASSTRIYLECAPSGPGPFNAGKIDFPIAATVFPREIFKAPRSWAEQLWSEIVYWNEVDHGGHFAAMEQPETFVGELRSAFRSYRA